MTKENGGRAGAIALVAAACSSALLLAAPAQAESAVPADSGSGVAPSVVAGGFLRDTALCPVGKVVVGGGAKVVGGGSADFRTSIQESAPDTVGGGQSVWMAAVRNNDVVAHTIGVFAVCADSPAGYQVVRKDVVVGSGGFLQDIALCPVGKVALAGGAKVVGAGTADFRTSIQETAPGTINGGAQSGWFTTLRNNDAVARTIGLFAVCALAPTGYEVIRKDVVVPAFGFLRDTALCTGSHVVFGGGGMVVASGIGDFRTRLQEIAPDTTGPGGMQALYLTALRNNDIVRHTIGLFAVCARPLLGYEIVRKDV